MPDLIRLEYRNVTMRFAQDGGQTMTAVQDVNIAVRDAFAAMERQLKDYVSRRWRTARPQPDEISEELQ